MLSVIVSAGEYPDTDDDGICEYPFCGQIDLCPKAACEELGFPIEVCQEKTGDRDNDGVGDACDACPDDANRFEEPCGRPRRGSGGGGGGGGGATGAGCRSTTNYNGALHQTNGWGCITDNDCHNTAKKLSLNPADYACVITSVRAIQNIVSNTCMCASVLKTSASGPSVSSSVGQPTQAAPYSGAQARDATVRSPPARTRQPVGAAFSDSSPTSGGTSGLPIGLLAGLGVLLAAGAGLYLYTRPKKRR